MTLTVDEVSMALLEIENIKELSNLSHGGDHVLTVKLDLDRGRSKLRGRYYDRKDSHFQSRLWRDIECYYCHKKGHIKKKV